MKISLAWLKDFLDLEKSTTEIGDILTQTGLEVEGIEKFESIKGGLDGLVVGEILHCEKHPNADKLNLTKVDIGGKEPSSIVCGAPNVAVGQKVIVATVGATLYPISGESFQIKKAKIRGEESLGMICAEDEIGLGSSHDGIIVLDTEEDNGTPAANVLPIFKDEVLEIGLTPNRGDGASHMGTARDLAAYFEKPVELDDIEDLNFKDNDPIKVTVEHSEACPRYSGVTIRGIKVHESPDWLKARLRSINLDPINNVVDITNYVLHGLGQPLHAFDADKIGGKEIIVKTLPGKSKFVTLDEKERELHEKDLMICDGNSAGMCIAGVFGGVNSGITKNTENVFLESAYFSPDYIRSTSSRHSLSTDASFRYERGTDPEMTVYALKYATKMILELAGGNISSELVDLYPNPIKKSFVKAKFQTFNRLIGQEIPPEKIISILNSLDIQTEDVNDNSFTALVPPFRRDVTREADLVEEVLRIFGFNNIELGNTSSASYLAEFSEIEPYKMQEDISHFLAGKGFHEILTNSITNKNYDDTLGLGGNTKPVDLLNYSSEELNRLKTSPLYTGLEAVRHNKNRRRPNLKFFEFSKTYGQYEGGFNEDAKLCIYLTGKNQEDSWRSAPIDVKFHDLAQVVFDTILHSNVTNYTTSILEKNDLLSSGIKIKKNKKLLGILGELRRPIRTHFSIENPVFYAELDWDKLFAFSDKKVDYTPLSKFPEVKRDLSLVIDKKISYEEIKEISFNSEKKLLTRMNVFSIFEGDQIGTSKKAYAISFYLQDNDKTLTDKVIDKAMNRLISKFESELNAVIRR